MQCFFFLVLATFHRRTKEVEGLVDGVFVVDDEAVVDGRAF